jgi:hypothetical protein
MECSCIKRAVRVEISISAGGEDGSMEKRIPGRIPLTGKQMRERKYLLNIDGN